MTDKCLHLHPGGSECSWDKERLTSPPAGAHGGGPGGGGGGAAPAAGGGAGGGGSAAGGAGRGPGLGAVNQQQLQQQQLLANSKNTPSVWKDTREDTQTHTSPWRSGKDGNIC